MTSFVFSLVFPSQAVIHSAMGGLLALLVAAQIVDYEGSGLRSISRYVNIFSIPLIIWFAFSMIVQIGRIINS